MNSSVKRRNFLKALAFSPACVTAGLVLNSQTASAQQKVDKPGSKLKISLNAYSFNKPLRDGSLTMDDLLDFCAINNFDAVDLTGYYFPGYPTVPTDSYIYHLKQKAFRLGLDISGTGIKNDSTNPDEGKRREDITLVKNWIECAAKLGAPVIRVFAGLQTPQGYAWNDVAKWVVEDFKECAEYGKANGVIVAMQNHDDFIKTADQAQQIIEMVNSEWFGLVLDIGSYRSGDPYKQIEQTARYAVNWQLKEAMYFDGVEQKTDLSKVVSLIIASGYRGYVPIETLGAGDPKTTVPVFLAEVRKAFAANGM
jgi:sugar phosphate isomerase/epimerase